MFSQLKRLSLLRLKVATKFDCKEPKFQGQLSPTAERNAKMGLASEKKNGSHVWNFFFSPPIHRKFSSSLLNLRDKCLIVWAYNGKFLSGDEFETLNCASHWIWSFSSFYLREKDFIRVDNEVNLRRDERFVFRCLNNSISSQFEFLSFSFFLAKSISNKNGFFRLMTPLKVACFVSNVISLSHRFVVVSRAEEKECMNECWSQCSPAFFFLCIFHNLYISFCFLSSPGNVFLADKNRIRCGRSDCCVRRKIFHSEQTRKPFLNAKSIFS